MLGARRGLVLAASLVLALVGAFSSLRAQEPPDPRKQPALLQADEVTYDEQLRIVTARGDVEVAQDERILLADSLSYNLKTDIITAQGNVSLLEPDGEVIFAEYVQLTGDLREGAVKAIRMLLTDRSRLAAAGATRTGGNRTELRRAVFSPCELCKEDPSRAPLWQLKAVEVIHDQEAKVIQYRDAWMEVFGLPVIYTPFFQHPDPTVQRQSGLLTPSAGVSDLLGFNTQIPYFWAISDSQDATIAPIFTTKRNPVFVGEYRQRFANGSMELKGSATIGDRPVSRRRTDKDEVRGHIDGRGRFNINDTWRWGFDVWRTSDPTYLNLYDFRFDRTLTSRAFAEGFRGRNYAAVNAYTFQGLRGDINSQQPIILPEIDLNYQSEPGTAGGKYFLDANSLILTRLEGRDSRRLSVNAGWTLPHISSTGLVTSLTASLRGDAYWVNGFDPRNPGLVDPPAANSLDDELTGRVYPRLSLRSSYPLVNHAGSTRHVVEPIAQVVVGANSGNPDEIPNEDSQGFEFDDTNLFEPNRFPGFDLVDTGQRVDYGLNYSLYNNSGRLANAFLGQSYRISGGDEFGNSSGVQEGISDIVGRLYVTPKDYFTGVYRFRLDDDSLDPKLHELNVNAGTNAFNASVGYSFLQGTGSGFGGEELVLGAQTRVTEHWSASFFHRRNLRLGDPLESSIRLTYQDECFLMEIIGAREHFANRDIRPDDSIFLRFVFKHLGELERFGF